MNIRNVHNTIPLHVALARGANSCVGLLLSSGANCNLQVYLHTFEIYWYWFSLFFSLHQLPHPDLVVPLSEIL